jgi:ubiquitin-conjugating enzyme E2 O
VELIPTSKLNLIDRSLLIGDIVKRDAKDAQSGVVLNTFTKCTLLPMCDVTYQSTKVLKGLLPPGIWKPDAEAQFCVMPGGRPEAVVDVPAEELIDSEMPTEDDLVIYKDWIGRVEAITNMLRVQLTDNCVVEVGDGVGEHVDGAEGAFSVGDIVKTKKASLRLGTWVFGKYNPNTPPVGTVVSIRTMGAEIVWLEARIRSAMDPPPGLLEVDELESSDFQVYDRSKRPSSIDGHANTISNSEFDTRLNLRVRFRNPAAAMQKYPSIPWLDRTATLGYDLNVFDITSFRTDVTIQWQDLSITKESSIDVVPDSDIDDEHAAWPGEIAHSLGMVPVPDEPTFEQPERIGVVQAVNSADRLANVIWCDQSGYACYTKAGADGNEHAHLFDYAVPPATGPVEELSLYDISTTGVLNVRRGDIVLFKSEDLNPPVVGRDVSWVGEIVDTMLDGRLVVRLGASGHVRDVVARRDDVMVAVRSDGTAQMDEWDEDEAEEGFDDEESEEEDWSEDDYDVDEEELPIRYEDENGEPMEEEEAENEDWESADEDAEMFDAQEQQPAPSNAQEPQPASQSQPEEPSTIEGGPPPYEVLDTEVPTDHHFATKPSTDSFQHSRRTMKEHKILRTASALPPGVYIRTWASRLDLLRILLVGPSETPYAHCPFVLDLHLGSEFPGKPPSVFFHSWPVLPKIGGTGKVNPNLYEDGMVCLSLLGTWSSGGSSEEWSPSRSTILQVVVSLLGLVLVREPYFNEAGYEGLVGNEESKRPSALYSERVFLRAQGFLISAVEQTGTVSGLAGMENVVRWLYRDEKGPRLLDVATRAVEKTLERSRGSTGELDGLTVMSKGACTSLSRVLEMLKGLCRELM